MSIHTLTNNSRHQFLGSSKTWTRKSTMSLTELGEFACVYTQNNKKVTVHYSGGGGQIIPEMPCIKW